MYRIVALFLEPYTLLLLCTLLATLWAWWRRTAPSRALRGAVAFQVLLIVLSMPAVGFLALGTLEWAYPPTELHPSPEDTLVVLAADMLIDDAAGDRVRLGPRSIDRCLYALELYRDAGRCRVILSGGKVNWANPGPTLAETMRDFLVQQGVRPDDLELEDRSSTTFENAHNTQTLLKASSDGRAFLVTSASHMGRSVRCFRALDVAVIPAPCDHRALYERYTVGSYIPRAHGIANVGDAVHEWLGFVWYRLQGRL
ncbi:MAG: YdcF family protein [Planctomycetales bacterium]